VLKVLKEQREKAAIASVIGDPYADWWESVLAFLNHVGKETLVTLSPDYESGDRLREVILGTKQRIEELLKVEADLPKALQRLSDDQAVRILTIHKSKGLEFDSVIMLAVEEEIFFGDQSANRCAFFVGVSRAKRRLVLTHADQRERPSGYTKRWDVARKPQSEYFGYVMPFVSI
jgi:superfamily I DNA/RNA helicase